MTAQNQRPPLQQLLSEAFNAPNCIHTQDGGAVLALSIHCKIGCVRECTSRFGPITASSKCCAGLFVQAGFTSLQTLRPNGYTPQPHWDSSREAWTFQYKKYAAACRVMSYALCTKFTLASSCDTHLCTFVQEGLCKYLHLRVWLEAINRPGICTCYRRAQ